MTPTGTGTPTSHVTVPGRDRSGTFVARRVWDRQELVGQDTRMAMAHTMSRHRTIRPGRPSGRDAVGPSSASTSRPDTETEDEHIDEEKTGGLTFSFAKVWAADKGGLEEMPDELTNAEERIDSWAQTLARLALEREQGQAQEATGRGVRRKAAAAVKPKVCPIACRSKI